MQESIEIAGFGDTRTAHTVDYAVLQLFCTACPVCGLYLLGNWC